jgi:hypothetical protein
MNTSCEFIKLNGNNGFSIWIDIDQPYDSRVFFKVIEAAPELKILSEETVYLCFGPAQTIKDYKTKAGIFSIDTTLEDIECGITIYSSNKEIMAKIYNQMILSGNFHERL